MNILQRFFKKKKNKTWDDISLKKFYDIRNILEVEDEYTLMNLISTIYGIEGEDLTIEELYSYDISFLDTPIENKNIKLKDTIVIGGRKYKTNINIPEMTTSQFIDFTNYCRENDMKYEKLLSVFIIPEGHKYNDGYNLREVQEDIMQLPIAVVQSYSFFMIKELQVFVTIFQLFSREKIEKVKSLTKKEKELIIEHMQKELNLGYSQS